MDATHNPSPTGTVSIYIALGATMPRKFLVAIASSRCDGRVHPPVLPPNFSPHPPSTHFRPKY
eukprot:scaffold8260_cov109-Isochrysis_galbana.AAC.5